MSLDLCPHQLTKKNDKKKSPVSARSLICQETLNMLNQVYDIIYRLCQTHIQLWAAAINRHQCQAYLHNRPVRPAPHPCVLYTALNANGSYMIFSAKFP